MQHPLATLTLANKVRRNKMATIQYREVIKNGYIEAEILDENCIFDLNGFAQACGQSTEWVLQLLEYEILPAREDIRIHQFFADELLRARRAYRLQRDFEASLPAVAMMLDLIDEVQSLRKKIKHFPH